MHPCRPLRAYKSLPPYGFIPYGGHSFFLTIKQPIAKDRIFFPRRRPERVMHTVFQQKSGENAQLYNFKFVGKNSFF